MEGCAGNLTEVLGLDSRDHIALVGGGGKTSLLFALAGELVRKNRKVITSTTTKIWYHEAQNSSYIAFVQNNPFWKAHLREGLRTHGQVFLAEGLLDSGKVKGISPSLADELYQSCEMEYLLVEADGAAGHPVKAPADFEPVIPSSATKVVALIGLEAIGGRLEPEVVFRMDLFAKLTGIYPGEKLTLHGLAKLFLDSKGLFKGTPVFSKRLVFLNKFDIIEKIEDAKELASLIMGNSLKQIDRVVIGSISKGEYFLI
ncbi:MAG: selenium cofactor biosynthesis protein YqeC [Pseudomonadota bacterium]